MKSLLALNLLWLTLTGCAAYELKPLPANHPANSEAKPSIISPSSKTLAYTSADMPARKTAQADAQGHDAHHAAPGQTAVGEGKIVATVPESNQLVVEHGAIQGVMDAMTMGYPVDPPSLLQGFKPGDRIRFTMDLQKKTIVKLEKLNQ